MVFLSSGDHKVSDNVQIIFCLVERYPAFWFLHPTSDLVNSFRPQEMYLCVLLGYYFMEIFWNWRGLFSLQGRFFMEEILLPVLFIRVDSYVVLWFAFWVTSV